MRIRRRTAQALLVSFFFSASACAKAAEFCAPLPSNGNWLPRTGVMLVGETHGNKEMPKAFLRMVCTSLRTGVATAVGLELPKEQAVPVQAYLASNGSRTAKDALLGTSHWQTGRDGRASAAYLEMIEHLRVLARDNTGLSVFVLYEDLDDLTDLRTRADKVMANRIRKEHLLRPNGLVLAYSGNFHAMLTLSARLADIPTPDGQSLPKPMGQWLSDLNPVSINLTATGGSTWACMNSTCGVHAEMKGPERPLFELTEPEEKSVYSAEMNVGTITASAPAVTETKTAD